MRRSPMRRTGMKRKPPRKKAMTDDQYRAVMDRTEGRCEASIAPDCKSYPEQWHHRQSRSVGGHQASNGLGLCKPCHDYVHANPTEAGDLGLIVSRHHSNPGDVLVNMGGVWFMLDDDGGELEVTGG